MGSWISLKRLNLRYIMSLIEACNGAWPSFIEYVQFNELVQWVNSLLVLGIDVEHLKFPNCFSHLNFLYFIAGNIVQVRVMFDQSSKMKSFSTFPLNSKLCLYYFLSLNRVLLLLVGFNLASSKWDFGGCVL